MFEARASNGKHFSIITLVPIPIHIQTVRPCTILMSTLLVEVLAQEPDQSLLLLQGLIIFFHRRSIVIVLFFMCTNNPFY